MNIKNTSKTTGVIQPIGVDYLLIDIVDGKLSIKEAKTNKELCKNNILSQKKTIIDNRIYVINDDKISEIKLMQLGNNIIPSYGNSWTVLPKATKVFRGMFYSDVLGVPYLYIPYNNNKMGIFKIDELKGYRIQDAKYDNGICIIVASKKNGTFDRLIIKFKFEDSLYNIDIENNITQSSVNFVTLDNGITVLLTGDDSIEIFHNAFSATKKIINDVNLNGDSILFKNLNKVYIYSGKNIYQIEMKK